MDNDKYTWLIGYYLCRGTWLEKLKNNRNLYTMDKHSRTCIVNLEKVINANIYLHSFSDKEGDNLLHLQVSSTRNNNNCVWCMLDADYVFLLEETHLWEDMCEYDIGEANMVLQMQQEAQQ